MLSVCALLLTSVQLFEILWTVAHQAPLMGLPRQEHWGGLPFPSPGDLPDPGIEPTSPVSPVLQADSLPAHFQYENSFSFKINFWNHVSSVQFSHSVVSDSLRPHGLQYARLPCPSSTPRVYSNSCPSSWWCHPTIWSSVIPFSSHLQSFPASGSFQMSQFFSSGGQSIGVSTSASVLPMNIQDWWFLQDWLVGSPCNPRDSQESYPMLQFKSINSLVLSCLYSPTHNYWKNHNFD